MDLTEFNQDRLQRLLCLSADWSWEQDSEFRFTDVRFNRGAGLFERSKVLGKRRWDLDIATPKGGWGSHQATLEAHQAFTDFVYCIKAGDRAADWQWYCVSGEPIFDSDGRFAGYHGVGKDITEPKRLELEIAVQTAHLRAIVDNFPGAISLFDEDLHLVRCNDRFRAMLPASADLFERGLPTLPSVVESDAEHGEHGPGDIHGDARWRMEAACRTTPETFERTRPDGTVLEVRRIPIPEGGFVTAYMDITARKQAERALAESEARACAKSAQLEATLAHMNQGLSMFDRSGQLVVWNRRLLELYGIPAEAVSAGISFSEFLRIKRAAGGFNGSPEDFAADLRLQIAGGKDFRSVSQLTDGRIIEILTRPTLDGGWVATHEDVTERERAALHIEHLAHHDALTGLSNRVELQNQLARALRCRGDGAHDVSILFIDLDRFKAVNDTFGHGTGDTLLKLVAARLSLNVRSADMVARLGGDEFAVLQRTEDDPRESAISLATRLLRALEAPFDVNGRRVNIGASIGIALAPRDSEDIDELLRKADLALYKAKAEGRSRFRIFEASIDAENRERCALEAELRGALDRDEFEVFYQPIVSIEHGHVCAVEALLRWNHRTRGRMAPDTFIPLAEETGLIVAIEEFVIRQACSHASGWPADIRVAINISPEHIRKQNLTESVTAALLASRLDPRRLEIEVTESVLLQNDENILGELHQLRSLGVSIVLDDFGTGYSSLSYLRMFSFDRIKIDRSFVAELTERSDCIAIVCAITGLARSLNMVTTAEGVETAEQLTLLKAAACSQAQGFLFGKPVPLRDLRLEIGFEDVRRSVEP